jgi:hypothetical protein
MSRWAKQCLIVSAVFVLSNWASTAQGQESQEEQKAADEKVQVSHKVLKVEHVDVRRLRQVLQIFAVEIHADEELKVISVRGMPESVAALEASLERLDVPPPPAKNIDLTVYLLNAKDESAGADEIPSEIKDVVEQIKAIFPYDSFWLWETIHLRTRDAQSGVAKGPKMVQGIVSNGLHYEFGLNSAKATPDDEGRHLVRLDGLQLEIAGTSQVVNTEKGPESRRSQIAFIRTDIDVRESQKVVVGKANIGSTEGALFLVVTARVE